MKVLLDENTPHKLRLLIDKRHTTVTTWYQGWSGLTNGELLIAAEDTGFDVLVTADQELVYQQNLRNRKIAVLILSTNNWSVLKKNARRISEAIDSIAPGTVHVLECS